MPYIECVFCLRGACVQCCIYCSWAVGSGLALCCFVLLPSMAAASLTRWCPKCSLREQEQHKWCQQCIPKQMLHYHCHESDWKGAYTHWVARHRPSCVGCNTDLSWSEKLNLTTQAQLHHMHFFDMSAGRIPCISFSIVIVQAAARLQS